MSRKMFGELKPYINSNSSILDIGGGIGGLQWEFMKEGGKSSTHVDSSYGYLEVATDLEYELGFESRSQRLFGDFTDLASEVSSHSLLVMDKVLCCYPDYHKLLESSLGKCENVVALSFPMGGLIAKAFRALGVIYLKIIGNPFRPYVHNPEHVHEFVESLGFKRSSKQSVFPWNVWLYERNSQS